MYLLSALQGQGTSSTPSVERHADRVHAGDELAVGAEHLERALAHPGHDPHRGRRRRRSRSAGRRCGRSAEPSGPIEKGTTYIVRPFMQPLKRPSSVSRISAGSRQLLVGPASVLVLGADEGAVLDPGDVAGVGEGEVGVRPLGVGEALEGAGVDQGLGERVVLLGGAVAPVDGVGLGQGGDLPTQSRSFCVGGQLAVAAVVRSLIRLSLLVRFEADDVTSASLFRIFRVADFLACRRLACTSQVKVAPGLPRPWSEWAIDGLDLFMNRVFEARPGRCQLDRSTPSDLQRAASVMRRLSPTSRDLGAVERR